MKHWIFTAAIAFWVAVVPAIANDGRIAYVSNTGNSQDIFLISPDGTGKINITNTPDVSEGAPSWNSDGTRLVFSAGSDIRITNADGSNGQSIPLSSPPLFTAFKPNSALIGYTRDAGQGRDIYVINADGSNETRIINRQGDDTFRGWSPDGSKLLFVNSESFGGFSSPNLYTANADGSGQKLLRSGVYDASWSPDSGQITFESGGEIYVMNADGSRETRVTENSAFDIYPVFNPNGSKIAFASSRDGNYEIYVMNADGSGARNITNSSPTSDHYPAWGQVLNPDAPRASISNATPVTEGESGTTNANFTISLSARSTAPVTVSYRTYDESALGGSDYVEQRTTTLTFAPGETSKTISVPILGDALDEPDETFAVRISATGATIAVGEGTATIEDDDGSPDFRLNVSVNDVTIKEGTRDPYLYASRRSDLAFTLTLSAATGRTVTVEYEFVHGTTDVIDFADYDFSSRGTITFKPGETTKTFNRLVVADASVELDETCGINLSNATNAAISDSQGLFTILNDDAAPTITGFTPAEGSSGTSVTITGTNFTYPTIEFNGRRARITSFSSTQIIATVPHDATTGPIRVVTDSGSVNSAENFTVFNSSARVSSPLASPTSLEPGQTTVLSVDATHTVSASDLRYVHLMLSPTGSSLSDPSSGLWMHFNVVEQKLYAWNGTGWGNGMARNAVGTLTTPQGIVSLSESSITSITSGYRINVSFTPNTNFTGTFVLRALAQDTQPRSGWDIDSLRQGSIVTIATPNIQPQVSAATASPSSLEPGETTMLSVDVTDADGAGDLRYVHLMLSPASSSPSNPRSGLWMHYNVIEQRLYAWNGTDWGTGIALGASGTLVTAQGTINVSPSSITSIANGYRSNVSFTPNTNFTGTFVLRALGQDTQPRNGWDIDSLRPGSIVTIARPNAQAEASSPTASPTSLAPGERTNLAVDITDADGAADLRYVHVMLSPAGSSPSNPRSGLWMHFNVVEQKLYAWNGSGWGLGMALGSRGILTTAQGTVDIGASSVTVIPNGYRISIAFIPNSSYLGTFVTRALPQDARPVNGWDLNSLRDGSIVTIGNSPSSSTSAAKTIPSGGSS